jgi:hypothetical protein
VRSIFSYSCLLFVLVSQTFQYGDIVFSSSSQRFLSTVINVCVCMCFVCVRVHKYVHNPLCYIPVGRSSHKIKFYTSFQALKLLQALKFLTYACFNRIYYNRERQCCFTNVCWMSSLRHAVSFRFMYLIINFFTKKYFHLWCTPSFYSGHSERYLNNPLLKSPEEACSTFCAHHDSNRFML